MSPRGIVTRMMREDYMRNVVVNLVDNIERVGDPEPAEGHSGSSREPARASHGVIRLSKGSSKRSSSAPVDGEAARLAGNYQYAEPLRVEPTGKGYHCVVPVWINGLRFRITIDSGCARSFIQKSFAEQLEATARTRSAVQDGTRGDKDLSCLGIRKDMVTNFAVFFQKIDLEFRDVPDDGRNPGKPMFITQRFVGMEDAADCLVIGFPDLIRDSWPAFHEDVEGYPWVEFRKAKITLLGEKVDPAF